MAAVTSQWWRRLVNAYEVKAGLVCLQCKTVWSIPERFRSELLTVGRYTNLCTLKNSNFQQRRTNDQKSHLHTTVCRCCWLLLTCMSEYFRSDVGRSTADHVDRFDDLHREAKVRQLQRNVAVWVSLDLSTTTWECGRVFVCVCAEFNVPLDI